MCLLSGWSKLLGSTEAHGTMFASKKAVAIYIDLDLDLGLGLALEEGPELCFGS